MAFKLIALVSFIAVANAGLVPTAVVQSPILQRLDQPILTKQLEAYDPNPQYSFSYNVQDSYTGDVKNQQETRSGDNVQGQYSLIDADGFKRTVDYTSDSINGFNAVVVREPLKGAIAQPALKSIVSQPILKSYVAQPAYAAPAAFVSKPAFVAQSSFIQPILKSYAQPAYGAPAAVISQPAVVAQSNYIQPAYRSLGISYTQPAISIAQPALLKSPTIAYSQLY
uniref:Cuticle protein n=1 Tax=Bradysia odoriphaga TaxID=1564500 RepID=A0A2H4RGQ0_9DIPT|nr:Cuticle protein [Bradysia odoriphaga]